jgi:hypothetical protein
MFKGRLFIFSIVCLISLYSCNIKGDLIINDVKILSNYLIKTKNQRLAFEETEDGQSINSADKSLSISIIANEYCLPLKLLSNITIEYGDNNTHKIRGNLNKLNDLVNNNADKFELIIVDKKENVENFYNRILKSITF